MGDEDKKENDKDGKKDEDENKKKTHSGYGSKFERRSEYFFM